MITDQWLQSADTHTGSTSRWGVIIVWGRYNVTYAAVANHTTIHYKLPEPWCMINVGES